MKNKFLLPVFLSVMMLVALLTGAAAWAAPASGAGNADMEKVKVSWDLKPGEPITIYTRFIGMEQYFPLKAVVTNMRKSTVPNGNIRLTFTVTITNDYVPKGDEIWFLANHQSKGTNCGGGMAWAVLDYRTGIELEGKNNLGVSVQYEEVEKTAPVYKSTDNKSFKFTSKWVCNVTVTFPKSYDGLCIGILGRTEPVMYDAETQFFEGKTPFSKTVYHSPSKKDLSQFMRVDAEFLKNVPNAK